MFSSEKNFRWADKCGKFLENVVYIPKEIGTSSFKFTSKTPKSYGPEVSIQELEKRKRIAAAKSEGFVDHHRKNVMILQNRLYNMSTENPEFEETMNMLTEQQVDLEIWQNKLAVDKITTRKSMCVIM